MSEAQWQRLTREWTPLEVVPSLPWWPVPCRAGFNHRNLRSQETQQKRGHKRSLFVLGSGDGCFACISINGSIRQDDEATYYSICVKLLTVMSPMIWGAMGHTESSFGKRNLNLVCHFFSPPTMFVILFTILILIGMIAGSVPREFRCQSFGPSVRPPICPKLCSRVRLPWNTYSISAPQRMISQWFADPLTFHLLWSIL